jgi:tyrosinase
MGFSFKVLSSLVLGVLAVSAGHGHGAHATCTNPTKRQEWRALTKTQKADWLRAMKCLTHLPHTTALTPTVNPSDIPPVNTSSSYWDDIVYIHMDLNTKIHHTGQFLPWHRWYVHNIENALKTKCGYKGVAPYWDWTKDSSDFYGATIFKDSDPTSGLGGWGDPSKDFEVQDGAVSDFWLSYPSPHYLRRNFTLRPYSAKPKSILIPNPTVEANSTFRPEDVQRLLTTHDGDFKGFQTELEGFSALHSAVHNIMGGDLGGSCPHDAPADCHPGPTFSANEPLFHLHHGMVDRLWYLWQQRPGNKMVFSGGATQPNLADANQTWTYSNGMPPALTVNSSMPHDNLFPAAIIKDYMDTTAGPLCYVYV